MIYKNLAKTLQASLILFSIGMVFQEKAGAEAAIHIQSSSKTGIYYTDKSHWECRKGRWMCADEDYHQAFYNCWIYTDGKWYYVDKNGYMVTDAWVDDYYVGSNGEMKTGWINEGGDNWYYFYSDGTKAADTVIDGCVLGADGKWDK